MENEISAAWGDYRNKMNDLAVSLLVVSNHLDNVAKYCNECADECNEVARCINDYAKIKEVEREYI